MQAGKWICLIFAALLFFFAVAVADKPLEEALIAGVKTHYGLNNKDVEIEFRKNKLTSTFDNIDSLRIEPMTDGKPRGIISVRALLYKDNQILEKAQVRLMIRHFAEVIVAEGTIKRGATLAAHNIRLERRDITYLTDHPLTRIDQTINCWAKRQIKSKQIITDKIAEAIPLVKQNHMVTIIYRNKAFELTVPGRALEQGNRGDVIRVQNTDSRKTIACTIIDDNNVEINAH